MSDFVYNSSLGSEEEDSRSVDHLDSIVAKVLSKFNTQSIDHPWNSDIPIFVDCLSGYPCLFQLKAMILVINCKGTNRRGEHRERKLETWKRGKKQNKSKSNTMPIEMYKMLC